MTTEKLKRELGFRDVFLFYLVSGLSLRWIATAAASGQSAIVVWLLAWGGFFLLLAGRVLELSSRYPQEGGLFVWTREAYGDFPAFMAAWSYWMSNLPYFPAVLYFAASSLLFAAPAAHSLANSNIYYMVFTVGMLAFITVLNVFGLGAGKWLNNLGAVGMALPIAVLVLLGVVSYSRFGSATHFTLAGAMPQAHVKDLIFWSTLFFAFTRVRHAAGLRDADQLLCAQTRPTSPLLALGARLKVRRRKHGLKRFPPQLPFSGRNRKARRPNPGFDSPAVSYRDQWLMCRRIRTYFLDANGTTEGTYDSSFNKFQACGSAPYYAFKGSHRLHLS